MGLAIVLVSVAQVSVRAEMDVPQIFIGEQAHLTLSVSADAKQRVVFPRFENNLLTPHVEVIEESKVDTAWLNDGARMTLKRVYTLTAFEDSMFYLPELNVEVDGKPYKSKKLALKVVDFPVDTLNLQQFYGPKDVVNPEFDWSEWQGAFAASLLLIVAVVLLIVLLTKRRGRHWATKLVRLAAPVPPHQRAISEIERLKLDTKVAVRDTKRYYTELTDVLRQYIAERFAVNAMEMTTSEIIERLTQKKDVVRLGELRHIFETADLVKFAKHETLISENDINLLRAVDFITMTKEEELVQEPQVKRIAIEEQAQKRIKWTYRILVGCLSLLCLALLSFIVYEVYNLVI